MTWGMYENVSSFNSFLLDGEIEGHDEALERYYYEEMSDAERLPFEKRGRKHQDYQWHVTDKLSREPGYIKEGLPPTGPVLDHEAPPAFRLAKKPAKGLSAMVRAGYFAVSETLKNRIEALEPGVHGFWPIRIILPKGEDWPETYYTIRIGRYLESFDRDQSDERSWHTADGKHYYVADTNKKMFSGLAMSQSIIGSAHLWNERELGRPNLCMSDEMHAAFVETGFSGSKLYKLKDVA